MASSDEREHCPECGHADARDAFEGWELGGGWIVRCPKCEAVHPDQSDHDEYESAF